MNKYTIKKIIYFLFILLLVPSATHAADHSGQSYTVPISSHQYSVGVSSDGLTIWYGISNSSYGWAGQYFVAPENSYLGRIDLLLRNLQSTTDYITVEIRDDSGILRPTSKPTPALDTVSLVITTNTLPYIWHEFLLDNPPKLTAGNTYWICVESTSTASADGYGWWVDITVPVATLSLSDKLGLDWDSVGDPINLSGFYKAYEFVKTPEIISIYPADGSIGVLTSEQVKVDFNVDMDTASISAAMSVYAIKDSSGNTINTLISGTTSYSNNQYTFTPQGGFSSYHKYRVVITTNAKEFGGNALGASNTWTFTTSMSSSDDYTVYSDDGDTNLSIEASPFGSENYFIIIDTNPSVTSVITTANSRADSSSDLFFMPIDGTLREIDVYKGNPLVLTDESFSSDVELTISYDTAGSYVKDTSPPVREDTLAIYWLNEADSLWVRIPGSVVNKASKTVTASVNHFSVFTLMGVSDSDLSAAYAYPVPFKASEHTTIKFTGLSSQAIIKVFTVSGELVQTILEVDGDGFNDSLDVSALASGVYIYHIDNENEDSTDDEIGQLVIIK